ncbi:hypothetical protein [Microtetraspora niveoalba]|uniref:hypothetical protein n=1 Tax=Microtetraspora niveoalba TaxID=46175 RepID=UPI000835D601|nr:hypothetical protein [Microtetraspora niveoalba]
MLSKRARLALSAGVLGVALTTTLAAAASADEAPRPAPVVCENADVTVTEKDGKLVGIVDGKEVEATAAAVVTPAKSVPATSGAADSGTGAGDASAAASVAVAAAVSTPARTCVSSAATE